LLGLGRLALVVGGVFSGGAVYWASLNADAASRYATDVVSSADTVLIQVQAAAEVDEATRNGIRDIVQRIIGRRGRKMTPNEARGFFRETRDDLRRLARGVGVVLLIGRDRGRQDPIPQQELSEALARLEDQLNILIAKLDSPFNMWWKLKL
jgi:hypothetical protein